MNFLKRKLPIIVVAITGILMIIAFFVPHEPFDRIGGSANNWYMIIRAFTLVLGVTSLVRSHYRRIKAGRQGWGYSMMMFLTMLVVAVFGVIPSSEKYPVFGNQAGSLFMWFFDYINTAAAATVFSLLAFYIASAAYRAFRVRTIDATVMLLTALIVMIGRVPLGEAISEFTTTHISQKIAFLRLDNITSFLLDNPTVGARRAVFLGIALAMVSTSMRVIFGIERTYMGSDD